LSSDHVLQTMVPEIYFSQIKQVFSWGPIRCHDTVDVGWSRLADLNVHEGKLLGCSFKQSCVGMWVVDLTVCWLQLQLQH